MNRFNRDYAVVGHNGHIWLETHDKDRAAQVAAELRAEGKSCEVVKSDCPRRA
jgi:exosome complex RNA-binding protein Rrp4